MRLIITRPRAQAEAWVARLAALGVDAAALPLLSIAPPADARPVRQAWQTLSRHALVVFVSPNAVNAFFAAAPSRTGWPEGTLAGSVGPGTSAALQAAGVPGACLVEPDARAGQFDSEALWARLAARDWRGRSVLVVRGEQGRDWLATTLRSAGAEVGFVAAYRRRDPELGGADRALLDAACAAPARHCWHFSSSESIRTLARLAPDRRWAASPALVSHPRIAQAAQDAGFAEVERVGVAPPEVAAALRRRRDACRAVAGR